jgi:drug/metabolite transporter (DMT)-like permease
MIPVAFISEGVPVLSLSTEVWASLIAVALLSTAVAYLFYFKILARAGSANLMLVTLLIPPIAVGLSVTILEENMGNEALLGFGLIAVGLLVTDGRLLDKLRQQLFGEGKIS